MDWIHKYLTDLTSIRRYSPATVERYRRVLEKFRGFCAPQDVEESLNTSIIRSYEVNLMDSCGQDARSVNLHLSVLSGFCRFLMKNGVLDSNPVRTVSRPKTEKRLPVVYRQESIRSYLESTAVYGAGTAGCGAVGHGLGAGTLVSGELAQDPGSYKRVLGRLVILLLYSTGMRRAELIGLERSSVDYSRRVIRVHGKGDKIREIPVPDEVLGSIRSYLSLRAGMGLEEADSLLVNAKGRPLYPELVDNIVKEELAGVEGITTRRSPHVLRHTLATTLLNDGADLNSIKELLGHSSLAATQVYTHNSIEKLKQAYSQTHPLAQDDSGKTK